MFAPSQRRELPRSSTTIRGRDEFPFELIPHYAALGIAGGGYHGDDCLGKSTLFDGFVMKELARIDCSIATFHAVHSGLAMGSIYLCGSEEQKHYWLPRMRRCEKIGALGSRSQTSALASRAASPRPPAATARAGCWTDKSDGLGTRVR